MNAARAELIERALNRKYPQISLWVLSESDEGDIRMVSGTTVRVIPSTVFNGANVMGVFAWIEENCNLRQEV